LRLQIGFERPFDPSIDQRPVDRGRNVRPYLVKSKWLSTN
jgi:hypothetical protein